MSAIFCWYREVVTCDQQVGDQDRALHIVLQPSSGRPHQMSILVPVRPFDMTTLATLATARDVQIPNIYFRIQFAILL